MGGSPSAISFFHIDPSSFCLPLAAFQCLQVAVFLKNILKKKKKFCPGTSLAVRWLRLHTSTAAGAGSIPTQGTKILHATRHGQKKKKKKKNF